MFHIVLVHPEIPPNTGNVIRLAANTGAELHLVEPLGYSLDDKQLKRAGLDYHEYTRLHVHANWSALRAALVDARMFACTTSGTQRHTDVAFRAGDAFVFGQETRGLPAEVMQTFSPDARIRLPMRPGNRSLNLSNAVAVMVFEAWRQHQFIGSE